MPKDKIRIGVVGAQRGISFTRTTDTVGIELVAICDIWEEKLMEAREKLGVATYTDFDEFLSHDMDAVVLANYFHQHAPFAIKALRAGFHVMSECAACATLGEGVELIREVEKSGKIYMIAENCPYFAYNQEMRRVYMEGTIGKFLYGECEYIHPFSAKERLKISIGWNHWRNWLPVTYYCTHSVAPIMYITDTMPVQVNGFVIPRDEDDPSQAMSARCNDTASIVMMKMDNGAYVKIIQGGLRGHQLWTRLHGNRGLIESGRGVDHELVRLHRARFEKNGGEPEENIYLPDFPHHHKEAKKTGHRGGDFYTNYYFAEAIRKGKQPFLDVYRGVAMSVVGILAYQSALKDGVPINVPDFRDEEVRKKYENDDWSADTKLAKPGQPAPSVLGNIELSDEAKKNASKVWSKQGWKES